MKYTFFLFLFFLANNGVAQSNCLLLVKGPNEAKKDYVQLTSQYKEAKSVSYYLARECYSAFDSHQIGQQNVIIKQKEGEFQIIGLENRDLIAGTYYLLNQLGFQFLGLSDNWLYYPKNLQSLPQNMHVSRPILTRYFGTGGFGADKLQKQVTTQYQQRNGLFFYDRFDHTFTHFYKDNKAEIDQLQKRGIVILSDYNGKKIDPNIKEKECLELIKRWAEKRYLKNPKAMILNMSPADGIGNLQGRDKPNPYVHNTITKYFYIANEVAKYLNSKYPDFKKNNFIGYSAYGAGTGVAKAPIFSPDYTIASNFYIQLVPYAFQRDYVTHYGIGKDEAMFRDWQTKYPMFRYAVRDYWNITQWSGGLPQSNLFEMTKRVDKWMQYNIQSANIESTYFHALLLPHFWVLGQKSFRPNESIDKLYNDYFLFAFDDVAKEMEQFYNELSHYEGERDVPKIFAELNKALNKTQNELVKKRLIELTAYTHWLVNFYYSKAHKSKDNSLHFERWSKKIHSLALTQSFTDWKRNYGKNKSYGYNRSPDKWTDYLEDLSYNQLEPILLSKFKDDVNQNNKPIEQLNFNFDYTRVRPLNEKSFPVLKYKYQPSIAFKLSPPTSNSQLRFRLNEIRGNCDINLRGDMGYSLDKRLTQNDNNLIELSDLKPDETYTLTIRGNAQSISLDMKDISFFYNNGKIIASTALNEEYFYVPKEAKEILFDRNIKKNRAYRLPAAKGKQIVALSYFKNGQWQWAEPEIIGQDTNGDPIYKQEFEGVYRIKVPPGQSGRLWRVETERGGWKIINFEAPRTKRAFNYIE